METRRPLPESRRVFGRTRGGGFRDQRLSRPGMVHNHAMCRNIKTLFNFDPPATDEEIYTLSLHDALPI